MSDFEKNLIRDVLDEIRNTSCSIAKVFEELSGTLTVEQVEQLLRDYHSVKGNAHTIGAKKIVAFTHRIEDLLIKVKDQDIANSEKLCETLKNCSLDLLDQVSDIDPDYDEASLSFRSSEQLDAAIHDICDSVENKDKHKLQALVVDDDENYLNILSDELNDLFDFHIQTASNGIEALKSCECCRFDVILTDYKMPQMNGSDFIERLRSLNDKNKDTPVVMVSAFSPESDSNDTQWAKVFFVEKPIRKEGFDFIVKCALRLGKK